jgi:hypothetical protein
MYANLSILHKKRKRRSTLEIQNYLHVLPIENHSVYDLWVSELGKNVTLVNFCDRYVSSEHVLAWGERGNLRSGKQQTLNAIVRQYPNLNQCLGAVFIVLVALDANNRIAHAILWKVSQHGQKTLHHGNTHSKRLCGIPRAHRAQSKVAYCFGRRYPRQDS